MQHIAAIHFGSKHRQQGKEREWKTTRRREAERKWGGDVVVVVVFLLKRNQTKMYSESGKEKKNRAVYRSRGQARDIEWD